MRAYKKRLEKKNWSNEQLLAIKTLSLCNPLALFLMQQK